MAEQAQTQSAGRSDVQLSPAEILIRAVLERRTVTLVYEGLRRVVEPHLIGQLNLFEEIAKPLAAAHQMARHGIRSALHERIDADFHD